MTNETPILLVANLIFLTTATILGLTDNMNGVWLFSCVGLVLVAIRYIAIMARDSRQADEFDAEAAELSE